MGIRFKCHECDYQLNVKEFLAGKRGTCPKCGLKFRIPQQDQEYSIVLKPKSKRTEGSAELQHESPSAQSDPEPAQAVEEPAAESAVEKTHESESGSRDPLSPLAEEGVVWYVRPPSGGQYGPADSELMQQWLGENRVAEGCLVWRDGWPQWRAAEEVFAEQLGHPVFKEIDLEADLPTFSDNLDTPGVSASPAAQRQEPDAIGSRRRTKRKKRATMIALLTGVSVLLIGVLIVVVTMTGGSEAAN